MKTGDRRRSRPRQRRIRRRQRCCRLRTFSGEGEKTLTTWWCCRSSLVSPLVMTWITLQPADVGPLPLLHQSRIQLGAQAHVIHVVQQDANDVTWEGLQPVDGYHLAELHWQTDRQTELNWVIKSCLYGTFTITRKSKNKTMVRQKMRYI